MLYNPESNSPPLDEAAARPDWERVTDYTYRLEVPSGWLYRYETIGKVQMCFVPREG